LKCAREFCYKGVGARRRAQLIKKEEKDEKKKVTSRIMTVEPKRKESLELER